MVGELEEDIASFFPFSFSLISNYNNNYILKKFIIKYLFNNIIYIFFDNKFIKKLFI